MCILSRPLAVAPLIISLSVSLQGNTTQKHGIPPRLFQPRLSLDLAFPTSLECFLLLRYPKLDTRAGHQQHYYLSAERVLLIMNKRNAHEELLFPL